MDLRRLFLLGLVASLSVTALIAIAVLLFAEFDQTTWNVVGTTALLSGFSLLGMPGGALIDRNRLVWLGWLTLALAAVALAHSLVLLWSGEDWGVKFLATVVSFAVACSQASATTGQRRDTDPVSVRALYAAGIAGSFVLATLVAIAVWQEIEDNETYYRVLGALAVATLLATVLQPILRRAGRDRRPAQAFELTLATTGGEETQRRVEAPDFATAAATAIRDLEREGAQVVRVERR
jgi:MFS family permease